MIIVEEYRLGGKSLVIKTVCLCFFFERTVFLVDIKLIRFVISRNFTCITNINI